MGRASVEGERREKGGRGRGREGGGNGKVVKSRPNKNVPPIGHVGGAGTTG